MNTDRKISPHVLWIIGLLVAAVVVLISVQWSRYPNFVDRMNFAASLASLILAVLAILYAFMSNDAIAGSVAKIVEAARDLTGNNAKLEASISALHTNLGKRFDDVEVRMERFNSSQQIEATAPQTDGKIDAMDILKTFVTRSSWNGLKVLYATQLAYNRGKLLNLKVLTSADKRLTLDYAFGYFVASSSVGFFNHAVETDEGVFKITSFPVPLRDAVAAEIQRRIPLSPTDASTRAAEAKMIEDIIT